MNLMKSQDSEMQETLHSKSQQTEIFSTHGGSNLAKRPLQTDFKECLSNWEQDTGIDLWLGFTIGWDTVSAIKHVVRIASLMQYLLQDRRIMSVHFQKSIGGGLHNAATLWWKRIPLYVHGLRQETCSENWKHGKKAFHWVGDEKLFLVLLSRPVATRRGLLEGRTGRWKGKMRDATLPAVPAS